MWLKLRRGGTHLGAGPAMERGSPARRALPVLRLSAAPCARGPARAGGRARPRPPPPAAGPRPFPRRRRRRPTDGPPGPALPAQGRAEGGREDGGRRLPPRLAPPPLPPPPPPRRRRPPRPAPIQEVSGSAAAAIVRSLGAGPAARPAHPHPARHGPARPAGARTAPAPAIKGARPPPAPGRCRELGRG